MRIDDKAEKTAREFFGFAIRAELDEFQDLVTNAKDPVLVDALRLSVAITKAVVLDVAEGQQPSGADLRKLADTAASVEKRYTLEADEVYVYLSDCVFGDKPLAEVFSAAQAATLPFIATGNLLASYRDAGNGQKWWEYLDMIEAGIEAAPDPS